MRYLIRLADALAHPATRTALPIFVLSVAIATHEAPVKREPLIWEGTRPATAEESHRHDVEELRELMIRQLQASTEAAR